MFIKFLQYLFKIFLSIIPLITFFIFLKKYDIFLTLKIFIIVLIISFTLKIIIYKKIRFTSIINFCVLIILSILTIIFHNINFIKLKNIIFCLIFSILLIFSQIFMKKTFIQILLEEKIYLPIKYWKKINLIWCYFFVILSLLNFYIQYDFNNIFSNQYKIFIFPITFIIFSLFTIIYIFYIKKKIKKLPWKEKN